MGNLLRCYVEDIASLGAVADRHACKTTSAQWADTKASSKAPVSAPAAKRYDVLDWNIALNDLRLNFSGPFTLTDGGNSVFRSRHAKSAGIYLWTICQKSDNTHLIHYVGETTRLGSRHREHLTQILGLNYGIFNPEKAQQGVCEALWGGLWRDKTEDGPKKTLTEYKRINEHVLQYVEIITIFFAELIIEDIIRRHIEGCIGWNLRSNHPESKQLYPDDNQVGPMNERNHGHLRITVPEVIRGLDDSISY